VLHATDKPWRSSIKKDKPWRTSAAATNKVTSASSTPLRHNLKKEKDTADDGKEEEVSSQDIDHLINLVRQKAPPSKAPPSKSPPTLKSNDTNPTATTPTKGDPSHQSSKTLPAPPTENDIDALIGHALSSIRRRKESIQNSKSSADEAVPQFPPSEIMPRKPTEEEDGKSIYSLPSVSELSCDIKTVTSAHGTAPTLPSLSEYLRQHGIQGGEDIFNAATETPATPADALTAAGKSTATTTSQSSKKMVALLKSQEAIAAATVAAIHAASSSSGAHSSPPKDDIVDPLSISSSSVSSTQSSVTKKGAMQSSSNNDKVPIKRTPSHVSAASKKSAISSNSKKSAAKSSKQNRTIQNDHKSTSSSLSSELVVQPFPTQSQSQSQPQTQPSSLPPRNPKSTKSNASIISSTKSTSTIHSSSSSKNKATTYTTASKSKFTPSHIHNVSQIDRNHSNNSYSSEEEWSLPNKLYTPNHPISIGEEEWSSAMEGMSTSVSSASNLGDVPFGSSCKSLNDDSVHTFPKSVASGGGGGGVEGEEKMEIGSVEHIIQPSLSKTEQSVKSHTSHSTKSSSKHSSSHAAAASKQKQSDAKSITSKDSNSTAHSKPLSDIY